MNDTVRIAVIGNTSAGKTSFLRTLMRNFSFGEVGFLPSTDSKNEISDSNVTFIDTPGFQCAEMVREWAVEVFQKLERPSPEKVIDLILKHQDRTNLQLQEGVIKHDLIAWKALKDADVILFLVDVRQNPNRDGNLESSCLLLPDNQVQIIFNFLPSDKTELEKRRKPWDVMKNGWGIQGTFLDYDAFHRDFEAEMNVLRGIRSKLIVSSKVDLMERYIQKRTKDEKDRLLDSFKMVISLIQHLSEISFYIENVPKEPTDRKNSVNLYGKFYYQLYETIKSNLYAFCNSILYIWNFRTHENSESETKTVVKLNCYDEHFKSKLAVMDFSAILNIHSKNGYPMSKLIQLDASEISRNLTKNKVNESVSWDLHFSSKFPWVSDKRIYGSLSLQSQTDLLNSFIPCALDFIKKVRERGIATPTSLYHLPQDEPCQDENRIKFIMPTEPEYSHINAAFKGFKWKSQQAAKDEWIPKLLELFGIPKNS